MATIREKVREELAEGPMTAKELAIAINANVSTVRAVLQDMSTDWEAKIDKTTKEKDKKWKLTVPVEVSRRWRFKELLRAWK